jgi:hypothetical protein
MYRRTTRIAACSCGNVKIQAFGEPIMHATCYCKDCQVGGRRLEALPGATPVFDPDGGTDFLMYRKDRVNYHDVEPLLRAYKINDSSPTIRVVATCCNAAMFMNFEKGHWLDLYRQRFQGDVPRLQIRTCTKSKRNDVDLPNDAPNCDNHSLWFFAKLIAAWIPMLLRGKWVHVSKIQLAVTSKGPGSG